VVFGVDYAVALDGQRESLLHVAVKQLAQFGLDFDYWAFAAIPGDRRVIDSDNVGPEKVANLLSERVNGNDIADRMLPLWPLLLWWRL